MIHPRPNQTSSRQVGSHPSGGRWRNPPLPGLAAHPSESNPFPSPSRHPRTQGARPAQCSVDPVSEPSFRELVDRNLTPLSGSGGAFSPGRTLFPPPAHPGPGVETPLSSSPDFGGGANACALIKD
ncbi:unnamed protein product [Bemisia tabaci]|uniref:Uncharacterized protein n=1 Tax=Bemisia tabaci TaxID=7038 RepID=A0A9P0F746_BEMTA|nr:unnamed protein product [Bemisia tabaci]